MEYCILVVNPGSTSTKIAVFQGEKALLQKTIRHSGEELAPYAAIMDQAPFRLRCVEQALAGFDLTRLDAVCARGGMLPACPSGAFAVDQDMIGYLSAITQGAHASNLGCVMARDLAEPLHIPAYVYDPVAVDEMPPMARRSSRRSLGTERRELSDTAHRRVCATFRSTAWDWTRFERMARALARSSVAPTELMTCIKSVWRSTCTRVMRM